MIFDLRLKSVDCENKVRKAVMGKTAQGKRMLKYLKVKGDRNTGFMGGQEWRELKKESKMKIHLLLGFEHHVNEFEVYSQDSVKPLKD